MELTIIGFTWICYFTLHSLLATDRVKERLQERFPLLQSSYRLIYNGYFLVLLIVPVALVSGFRGPDLYAPFGAWAVVDRFVQLAAMAGFLWSLSAYDLREFAGFKQAPSPATLSAKGALRWCRHPLYFFGIVFIWAGSHNAATLLTAVLITAYIIVGMFIEESRLVRKFGNTYREYQKSVPMLIPWPRRLTRSA